MKLTARIRPRSGEPLGFASNTILALSGFAFVHYLLYVHPVGYVYFVSEDSWAEYATFVGWAMAAGLLAWTLLRDRAARRPGLLLLAVATFFVAGEEISWGQRFLGFRSPELFAARNLKGETNVHNLTGEPYYFHLVVALAVLSCSVLLPVLTRRLGRLRGWCSTLGIPIIPVRLWPFFLCASYFFAFSSLKKSEVAEMYLSIGAAATSLELALTSKRGPGPRDTMEQMATPAMIVALLMLTAVLVWRHPWPEPIRYSLNRFALLSLPAEGMHRQAQMLTGYTSRNPEFLTAEHQIRSAIGLMRAGRQAEARRILELALAEQEKLQRRHPDHPAPYRIAGQLLDLLARPEEAGGAIRLAVERDRGRLDRAGGTAAKAWVQLSLTETFLAIGRDTSASEHLSMALALAPDRRTRWQMEHLAERWVKKRGSVRLKLGGPARALDHSPDATR